MGTQDLTLGCLTLNPILFAHTLTHLPHTRRCTEGSGYRGNLNIHQIVSGFKEFMD